MRSRRATRTIPLAVLTLAAGGCSDAVTPAEPELRSGDAAPLAQQVSSAETATVYRARLVPLNARATERAVTGTATFTVSGGEIMARVDAKGLYPGIPHAQHIHGFTDGTDATCPSPKADRREDGDQLIDVVEGVPSYGGILVPLDSELVPVTQQMYPVAEGRLGVIDYEETAPVSVLEEAIGTELALERRVVVLHGINPDTSLPESVQSLAGLPATATLPVACGIIERVQ